MIPMTTQGDGIDATPGTTADPETGAEGDTDQLTKDDMLLDRGVDDLLDEGYSPPDRRPAGRLETELEQERGEPLDERLAQEEPEVWETDPGPDAGAREPDRADRLTAVDPGPSGEGRASTMATAVGVAGGAASAEEAAMHVIDEDEDAVRAEVELGEELDEENEQD